MSENNESLEQTDHPVSSAQEAPGAMLKRERERQGLALDTVSEQLNLRPAVVAGLEQDRYDQVPVVAYRRGYLRAYARLLGIDERPVVEAYNTLHGRGDGERRATSTVQPARPPSRLGAWIFKLVTLLVILGLIALTLLWWQSREGNDLFGLGHSEPIAVEKLNGETVTEGGEVAGVPSQEEPAQTAPPAAEMNPTDTSGAGDENPAAPGIAEAPLATPGSEGSPASSDAGENAEADASAADSLATDTPPESDTAQDVASETDAAQDTAASDTRTLSLTFNEQSWTEIYDADNRRVFVGLQSAGTQASAEGEPPFRLTIGNASGVELRYQGQRIDLTSYAGDNNVARFTLGE
ncbi:RodZ domain-containing protein [Halomonas sp. WWR20]